VGTRVPSLFSREMTEHRDINKIIIIGMGSSWKKAPMEGETWSLNNMLSSRPVKLLFLMHDIDLLLKEGLHDTEEIIENVNKLGIPVMTLKEYPYLPTAIIFPVDDMHSNYYTCSFAYMIAYAVHKGATAIDIYGVPLVNKLEYREQRACVEYWIGYARGRGIEVNIFGLTTLFGTGLGVGRYGYEWCGHYQK